MSEINAWGELGRVHCIFFFQIARSKKHDNDCVVLMCIEETVNKIQSGYGQSPVQGWLLQCRSFSTLYRKHTLYEPFASNGALVSLVEGEDFEDPLLNGERLCLLLTLLSRLLQKPAYVRLRNAVQVLQAGYVDHYTGLQRRNAELMPNQCPFIA